MFRYINLLAWMTLSAMVQAGTVSTPADQIPVFALAPTATASTTMKPSATPTINPKVFSPDSPAVTISTAAPSTTTPVITTPVITTPVTTTPVTTTPVTTTPATTEPTTITAVTGTFEAAQTPTTSPSPSITPTITPTVISVVTPTTATIVSACPNNGTQVSVEGAAQVFCLPSSATICSGDSPNGICPGVQANLLEGSYCAEIHPNVFGCRRGQKP